MNPDFTVAVFSFQRHLHWLIDNLRSVQEHVCGYKEIVLVWDDYYREGSVDFDEIRRQSACDFRLILQSQIYHWPKSIGEWGWIKQQLAKLLCHTYTHTAYTWILDGDCVLRAPVQLFASNGKPFLHITRQRINEKSNGYYSFMRQFYGIEPLPMVLVNGGGSCMFDRQILEQLWSVCQVRNQVNLVDCINNIINPGGVNQNAQNPWPFSEFETYANFAVTFCADRFQWARPNWTINVHNDSMVTYPILVHDLSNQTS